MDLSLDFVGFLAILITMMAQLRCQNKVRRCQNLPDDKNENAQLPIEGNCARRIVVDVSFLGQWIAPSISSSARATARMAARRVRLKVPSEM